MEKNFVKRAHNAFNQGDYQNAKQLYQLAAEQYGETLFSFNIVLCEKYLQEVEGQQPPTIGKMLESIEVKKLQEQVAVLKRQLREKDSNINERFEELAILTRMLEEKDDSASA